MFSKINRKYLYIERQNWIEMTILTMKTTYAIQVMWACVNVYVGPDFWPTAMYALCTFLVSRYTYSVFLFPFWLLLRKWFNFFLSFLWQLLKTQARTNKLTHIFTIKIEKCMSKNLIFCSFSSSFSVFLHFAALSLFNISLLSLLVNSTRGQQLTRKEKIMLFTSAQHIANFVRNRTN